MKKSGDKTKAKVGIKQTSVVGPQWFQCGSGIIIGQCGSGSVIQFRIQIQGLDDQNLQAEKNVKIKK
jgi:hypothetical protein